VSSVCAPVGGTRPGLPVSSASSCASASAARAAASRPPGASTKALGEGQPVGQPGQLSTLAGTVDPVRGQLLHCRVVEQIDGRDGDQFQPSQSDVGVHLIGEKGLDRGLKCRHGRPVPARHPQGAALQQQIGGRVRTRVPQLITRLDTEMGG